MRQRRIKLEAGEGPAVYHCRTKTVNGEWLFGTAAREMLRKHLWQVADFCGVEILTYAILSNHFHLLVRVPQRSEISDQELLRRYHVLHPNPGKYEALHLDAVRQQMPTNGPAAVAWRERQQRQMNDISAYMKLLKQRFSVWFNQRHRRIGTLWCERFRSSLAENEARVLRTVAAYIDLNAVRAGLVTDPKDYRFCGYAEAVAGNNRARAGLQQVLSIAGWDELQAAYRLLLFGTGVLPRWKAASIPESEWHAVLAANGRLPLPAILRGRIRHFTDGAVLGSGEFVAIQIAQLRRRVGRCRRTRPREFLPITD